MSPLTRTSLRALALAIAASTPFAVAAPAAHAGGKADRTAPTVSIAAPAAGASTSGTLTASGKAADNVGVARVEVSVDGGAAKVASGTTAWSTAVTTTAYANGTHTLTARAYDAAGNATSASVSFTVANAAADTTAPTVAITTPSSGTTVGHQVAVAGTAADGTGVSSVAVRLDGGAYQSASGTSSWTASIDASAATDGSHTVTARATDPAGNVSTTSTTISIASGQVVAAPAMSAGTIGGFVFQEADRDGVFETTDTALTTFTVYLYSGSGTYLGNAKTDASGFYRFTGLADGAYRVALAPVSWNALQADWVPDTTAGIKPTRDVTLAGTARADFGTRRIVRSTDPAAPISTYVGPSGLTVKSYDDVVTAKELHDRLMTGSLVGAEAARVIVRFDLVQAGFTTSFASQSNGIYTDYNATSDITWAGWLRGDGELFHEYGHAWSMDYAALVQQDLTLRAYLQARGVYGDARINSSYAWRPGEMIAEDYRELFGSATAQADTQINPDIPLAKDVAGLRSFLSTTFMQTRVP